MVYVFLKNADHTISKHPFSPELPNQHILWIDMLSPSPDELQAITKRFDLKIPTREEREEIEESARYFEEKDNITINTYFLIANIKDGWDMYQNLQNHTITFLFHKNILVTIRYQALKTIDEIQDRILKSNKKSLESLDLLGKIFEYRIEKDADVLEKAAKDTRDLRNGIFEHRYKSEDVLKRLAQLQDFHMHLRDSLFDKKRAMTSLLKSERSNKDFKKHLDILLKDVLSLIDFTNTNMTSLDNIQNIFSNQINIEQNKVIKFFTVITVAFMPPTLVGTIYGMNFQNMPELSWEWGYPIAVCAMIISVIIPLMYFKLKKWL